MKLLIEDFEYNTPAIKDFLKGFELHKGKVPFVGYLYSKALEDCVFFLPKVILDEKGKVFSKYDPDVIWDSNEEVLTPEEHKFLLSFPIWTYQAISIYNHRNLNNIIVRKQTISNIDNSKNEVNATFIDCILAMIRFAQEHKNILLFRMRNLHNGIGRVNWTKTISSQQPVLKGGKAPIYLNPVIKKKEIDYEEQLLVIYFSILRYLNNHYGFQVEINLNFELIAENDLLTKYGTKTLRNIKYKYFSDITLHIWQLCYAFFERKEIIKSSSVVKDYLLASDFDRLFEAMVDDIIGTPLPKYIKKEQEDGKEIDHLFIYQSLINPTLKTYYIADSKYYKIGHRPEGTSLFKQYTYARNLIQERKKYKDKEERVEHNDLFRDEKTEGYNIIPNFFLSAYINDFNYDNHGIIYQKDQNKLESHFANRLFDRETLLLFQYDINYLYVVKHYAINIHKEAFRNEIHQRFRNDILDRLNKEYSFCILELKDKPEQGKEQQALKDALDPIFRLVNGKVFCPKKEPSYTNLILALENKEEFEKENKEVKEALKKDFIFHEKFELGASIEEFLTKKKNAE